MTVYYTKEALKEALLPYKEESASIGFVPTMGALHEGHLSLVDTATKENTIVVVSIFVNPTQFDKNEDFNKYPRTFEEDKNLLEKHFPNCILFMPEAENLYGDAVKATSYTFAGIEDKMEGKHRPGHFDGVGTVVSLLFEAVNPTNAYFGEKDYQQLLIVKALVKQNNIKTTIVGCPIKREKNGLAMSSRNKRLSSLQLENAKIIYSILKQIKNQFTTTPISTLYNDAKNALASFPDFKLEYIEIADANTLETCNEIDPKSHYRCFIAVFVGKVRLIDNIALN